MSSLYHSTLYHIVDNIKVQKFKVTRSPTPETDSDQYQKNTKYWSKDDEKLFFNIFSTYGADFGILKHLFPSKTKKQIKRKCAQIEIRKKTELEMIERRRVQHRRKDFFDREVMQHDMIKWHNSKPNKPENVSEADLSDQ